MKRLRWNSTPSDRLVVIERLAADRLELDQKIAELHRIAVLLTDAAHDSTLLGLDLVHQLHRLENAERMTGFDRLAELHERGRAGIGRAVEGSDHRRGDGNHALGRAHLRRLLELGRGERRRGGRRAVGARANGDAHILVLDRYLRDARLLDDVDDVANPLSPISLDGAAEELYVGRGAAANRSQKRLGLLIEEAQQQKLLVAR